VPELVVIPCVACVTMPELQPPEVIANDVVPPRAVFNLFQRSAGECSIKDEAEQFSRVIKYYAMRKGYHCGLFYYWPDCEREVKYFSGAEFKSFRRVKDAMAYLEYRI
jgi:hypothetical protein